MRIKVDENISTAGVTFLRESGHDVATVREEGLAGRTDNDLFDVCVVEGRTLITLDRDFSHVLRFPPWQTAGIVILELGGAASLKLLRDRLGEFLAIAATRSVSGELWIVEPGRVRVRLDKASE